MASQHRLHEYTVVELVDMYRYMGGKLTRSKTRLLRFMYALFNETVPYQYGIKYMDYPILEEQSTKRVKESRPVD
jgi:hypothetical protein